MSKMKLTNASVGDKFSFIQRAEYGSHVASVYDYLVIRAGKRDIVCVAKRQNGDFVTNAGDGEVTEFTFNRHKSEVNELGDDEITAARAKLHDRNRRARISGALQRIPSSKYDDEFMKAADAFLARSGLPAA